MLPPEVAEVARQVAFRQPAAAEAHVAELAQEPAEMLAVAQIAPQLAAALARCADPDAGLRHLVRFAQAWGARLPLLHLFRDHPAALDALVLVIGASRYLADVLVRNPEFFELVSDSGLLRRPRPLSELEDDLDKTCTPFASTAAQLDAVRRLRRRELLRIGAADLLGFFDLRQTTEQLSHLADAVVRQCLSIAGGQDGQEGLIVLALGKLGGQELNYSSDIDLVFLVEHERLVDGATRTARRLTTALAEPSAEGFLYRVDLRLRPFGSAGALVVSTGMMLEYLATSAHPAERQAMLKARVVAGPAEAGEQFLERAARLLAADAATARRQARLLKERIEHQLARRGQTAGHVKLAPGGIRDVEFIVQALQIENAAVQPVAAGGNTLASLAHLAGAGSISLEEADELREAYVFLRFVEHRLQLMDNQQIHRLPDDPLELGALAQSLGFEGPDEVSRLQASYRQRVQTVRAIFERVTGESPRAPPAPAIDPQIRQTLSDHLRAFGLDLDSHELNRYAELLARIGRAEDVEIAAQRQSAQQWTIQIAACDRVGLLSLVTGLLAAERIDVVRGDVLTLHLPAPSPRPASARTQRRRTVRRPKPAAADSAHKILDIFTVRTEQWRERSDWDAFRTELTALVALLAAGNAEAARERIIERVSQSALAARQSEAPLYPVVVEVENDASPSLTQLSIRSTDTIGFLFEFTSALAVLGVNIERVEIRTVDHEVRDTFWVTDDRGRKIVQADRIHELRVAAALIKQFTHLLPRSPDPAQALTQFSSLIGQLLARPDWTADLASLQSDQVLSTLAELMGVSQFLWEDFLRIQHENLFPLVRDVPALAAAKSKSRLERELAQFVERNEFRSGPEDGINSVLRHSEQVARLNQFKDREMFRIDLRHITRRIDMEQFSRELSDLAEVVAAAACELCHDHLRDQFGLPRLEDGRACPWCVCALGKFGGRELGFASDIELIFVYEGEGTTEGPRAVTNVLYFDEFVTLLLRALPARREGIFEIDLRLRPHGKAGSLASSIAGFCGYFSSAGDAEQFERLALVKLRPVAGDVNLGRRIIDARDAFVYSGQPLDYENILHLRRRQAAELVPPHRTSAKHSPGGLVDIEYFVQARQIEAGCHQPSVRVTPTLAAIDRLHSAGFLPAELARELCEAYRFLRELIDALRVVRGHAKDLTLPAGGTPEFSHLARRLGCDSAATLESQIALQMGMARELWRNFRPD
jgi:glutamate-ammonia-ligase adenylyltransferase